MSPHQRCGSTAASASGSRLAAGIADALPGVPFDEGVHQFARLAAPPHTRCQPLWHITADKTADQLTGIGVPGTAGEG
ncbi:hypothetical protein [Streptantibioticus ferralitis]|uniref:Uncharacterized protein n=1 Tax=Streptantibioticus ferralitis TaxID=236510 RepID=A0ABT5YX90_9ACTN|nr:hypothetical protein [Streptantibioticus ferralitis]MDF2256093.1 hypothetical protein [Streptantibioticus ferralitis]